MTVNTNFVPQLINVPSSPKLKFILLIVVVITAITVLGSWMWSRHGQNPTPQGTRPRRAGPGGQEIRLKSGGNLQSAVNQAELGDTIVLEAGGTYMGPITLPKKDGDTYLTIRTSNLAGISKEGERINPSHAGAMPKILSPANDSAVRTADQAHHYKFIGVEFTIAPNASYVYNLINLGEDNYKSAAQFPHHLVFDRCYVHSPALNKIRRGIALNSGEASVLNSYVSGFAGAGDETQAIAGWNGPGPFRIINNYLEAGAEIVLFGGADPSIQGLVPSDIEIRRNHFFRPTIWQGKATVKGNFELKNARRVIVDGNLLDSEIRMTAFVLTVRNQNGNAPWSTIEDVTISNNIVKHASTGVNILGRDNEQTSQQAKRITVSNNLFVDIASTDMAYFIQVSGSELVTIDHNTVQQGGSIISAYGEPAKTFSFTNNIVQFNSYGITCFIQGNSPCGSFKYCNCFPQITLRGNVIADNANASSGFSVTDFFPPRNFIVPSYQRMGFVDYLKDDWRLQPTSPYRKRAADGRDPGVDFEALDSSGVNLAAGGKPLQ